MSAQKKTCLRDPLAIVVARGRPSGAVGGAVCAGLLSPEGATKIRPRPPTPEARAEVPMGTFYGAYVASLVE